MTLIQAICNDLEYLRYSERLSLQQGKDIYQQAMLQVCLPEMQERLENAKAKGFLEKYIKGIIRNLWRHRNEPNSSFYRITDHIEMWGEYKEECKTQNDHRTKVIRTVNELNKKIKSKEKEERESAKLLWRVSQSNVHTVKKEEGCHSRVIVRRITPIITDIKRKLDE